MLGYSTSWAAFHVLECMSSSKFHIKQIGYLAASQSFDKDTDVLMLCTNLLKKVAVHTHYHAYVSGLLISLVPGFHLISLDDVPTPLAPITSLLITTTPYIIIPARTGPAPGPVDDADTFTASSQEDGVVGPWQSMGKMGEHRGWTGFERWERRVERRRRGGRSG
jgi:hypothetical protein